MSEKNLLKYLNPNQKEAVLNNDTPLLILAGAGSGKTRVLTTKIAYLILNGLVSEFNILAFTFTNKAAKEMKERVGDILEKDISHMWIGTFHSICARILRRDIDYLGYNKNFTIYDTQDTKTLIKDIIKTLKIDEKQIELKSVIARISDYKNRMVDSEEALEKSFYPREKVIARLYGEYEKFKKKNNALDFDDLILLALRLLENNKDLRDKYSNLFKYVFVDEYQDTNRAQYQLIRLLTTNHDNICVVGDSDQSIYSWRGADINNILDFEKDYKRAKAIMLEQNYRSTQNILDAANLLIQNNSERKDKNLWTDNKKGDDVIYKKVNDERQEASDVVNLIYQMNNDGIPFREMAILYRTNAQSRLFEEKLMYEGLPHKVVGGIKFYDRKEVKDILAYMFFMVNTTDDQSLKRIINTPKRGIGATTVQKLESYALSTDQSMFNAIFDENLKSTLTASTINKLKSFSNTIIELINYSTEISLGEMAWMIFEKSGYQKMLVDSKTIEDKSRIENIESLINAVTEFEKDNPEASLSEYLQNVSLLSDVDKTTEEQGVSLMTIHAAKGLEYDVVFLTGMEEGLFPNRMALEEGGLEEERRLCYVAITRARKRLFISSCMNRMTYGQNNRSLESRFMKEIEEAVVNKSEKSKIDPYDTFFDIATLEEKKQEVRRSMQRKIDSIKSSVEGWDYRVGDKVRHAKFGEGMIVSIKDLQDGKELMVSFNNAGIKRLASNIAKLEKI
ncbi:MAG: UvrD-helicase domain-containing protein [Tissierellia bacterium]|nr:UvrD-helicase domain-containing protein [Tissierellia bacterium]